MDDELLVEEDEIRQVLEAQGLVVDDGNLISGPFIPDGRVRIHSPGSVSILGDGSTLAEAYADFCLHKG
jgi:hypothetical protein